MPAPQGILRNGAQGNELVISRTVDMTPAQVWAALTDATRLQAWYGTYSGDPASGKITITMTDGDQSYSNESDVLVCDPEREFQLRFHGDYPWHIGVELRPTSEAALAAGTGCTVSLVHYFEGADMDPSIGPGWEFYLDSFIHAETGEGTQPDFGDYFPAMADYYANL